VIGVGVHRAAHFEPIQRFPVVLGDELRQHPPFIGQLVARPQGPGDMLVQIGEKVEPSPFVVRRAREHPMRANGAVGRRNIIMDGHG
jgi:hypothetical protein